jgi:hypothetical protein
VIRFAIFAGGAPLLLLPGKRNMFFKKADLATSAAHPNDIEVGRTGRGEDELRRARRLPVLRGRQPQRLALFLDERQVVRDVVAGHGEQPLEGQVAAFVVDADAPGGLARQGAEDASQLRPGGLDDGQLLLQVAVVVGQGGGEAVLVGAKQRRAVVRDDPLLRSARIGSKSAM